MTKPTECLSLEEIQRLVLEQQAEAVAGSGVDNHLLNCERCAQATLNLIADETLIRAIRAPRESAFQDGHHIGTETDQQGVLPKSEIDGLDARLVRLTERLRELPGEGYSDAHGVTAFSKDSELDVDEPIDWSKWLSPAGSTDEIGWLDEFRILKLLGHGGMGGVFLAEDTKLGRHVALKVMRPESAAKPAAAERFLREARAIAAVRDKHIVTIFQVGQAVIPGQNHSVPFLAQELLHGETLDEKLRREGQLPISDCIAIAKQIAAGLTAAHDRGLIHRDIKPANVWLEDLGDEREGIGFQLSDADSQHGADQPNPVAGLVHVKLLDFGLARPVDDSENLTQSGLILGTPSFMAPEQARGETVDVRADLFSLGCVLYRMLTGKTAFAGKHVMATLTALATHEPLSPCSLRNDVPKELSELAMQLLSKNPDSRPATAREVVRQLAEMESKPASMRPPVVPPSRSMPIAAGFAAACLLFGIIVITLKDKTGNETRITIETPDGTSLDSVNEFEKAAISTEEKAHPSSATENSPLIKVADAWHSPDSLNPDLIPTSERFDWQPDELVAVIGTHQLRDWHSISHVTFHPSGEFFVSVAASGHCSVWSTGTLTSATKGEPSEFPDQVAQSGLSFAPDGSSFIAGRDMYALDLSNKSRPKATPVAHCPIHAINDSEKIAVSPDGHWLLMVGAPRGTIEIWDISGQNFRFVKDVSYESTDVANWIIISENGERLALHSGGYDDAKIQVWDVDWDAKDGPTLRLLAKSIPGLRSALSPDGRTLVVSGSPMSAVLNLDLSPPAAEFEVESSNWFQFSPDGTLLAHQDSTGVIHIRQRDDTDWKNKSLINTGFTSNARFWISPDWTTLVASEFEVGNLQVWDLTAVPPKQLAGSSSILNASFSPNGQYLATVGRAQSTVWSVGEEGFQPINGLRGELSSLGHLPSFSPDSKLVAFNDAWNQTHVWNLEDKVQFAPQEGFMCFASDGQTVETLKENQGLVSYPWSFSKRGRFETENNSTLVAPLPGGIEPRLSLRSLRSGARRYVDLLTEGRIQVRSLDGSHEALFTIQHPEKRVSEFALSADGQLLAAFPAAYGGHGVVWDLTESPPKEYELASASGAIDSCFSGDGRLLLNATTNGVEIHDWAAGRIVRQIQFPGPVRSFALHPEGHHLATVNGNGTVYILRLPELAE